MVVLAGIIMIITVFSIVFHGCPIRFQALRHIWGERWDMFGNTNIHTGGLKQKLAALELISGTTKT